MSENYNGWTNRETWAAVLHLENDEGGYTMANEWADEAPSATALAATICQFFTDEAEAVCFTPSEATPWGRVMVADVGSLWRVNWTEIAEGLWEEHREREALEV